MISFYTFAKILDLKIFTNINENIPKNCLVTIGFFDGVHNGHRYLLENLSRKANETGKEELVITLWPHPSAFFGHPVKLLTTIEEKTDLIFSTGIRNLLVLNFDKELASIQAGKFVNHILINKLGCSEVLMGYNNSFGSKSKKGEYDETPMIPINRLDKYILPGFEKVNSSGIRSMLEEGDVIQAALMLGRKYSLSGKIVNGYKIGRKIGFPTANLGEYNADKLIPAKGVYIVKAITDNNSYPAMLNIGTRPSFDGTDTTIEFHIPDFDGDLYDAEVRIEFVKYLRPEKKFSDINDLINQLKLDRDETRAFFAENL